VRARRAPSAKRRTTAFIPGAFIKALVPVIAAPLAVVSAAAASTLVPFIIIAAGATVIITTVAVIAP
jgi:hypothetical protein